MLSSTYPEVTKRRRGMHVREHKISFIDRIIRFQPRREHARLENVGSKADPK